MDSGQLMLLRAGLSLNWFVTVFNRSRYKPDLTVSVHQVSKKYVSKELAKEIHAKAAPFVKWLKEAEEESEGSEEEEEEEDENVEVSERCRSLCFTILCLSDVAAWLCFILL